MVQCFGGKMLAENSAAASVSLTQQVIFMDCLQDFHIWHNKEVGNFYTLPSSLFILQKSHSKGWLHSVCLSTSRPREKYWT